MFMPSLAVSQGETVLLHLKIILDLIRSMSLGNNKSLISSKECSTPKFSAVMKDPLTSTYKIVISLLSCTALPSPVMQL